MSQKMSPNIRNIEKLKKEKKNTFGGRHKKEELQKSF